MRTAVARAIKAARDAGRMRPEHEPYAALAVLVAAEVKKGVPTADLTRLSSRLEVLLSRLPLGEEAKPGDGPTAPPSGPSADGARAARLETGVGAGPTVGDTALP